MPVIIRRGSNDPFSPIELMSSPYFHSLLYMRNRWQSGGTLFPVRTILTFQDLNKGWITDTVPHLCNSWSCSWSLSSLFVRPETSLRHISVRPQKELSSLFCRGTRIEYFHRSSFKISHPSFHFIPTTAPD